MLVRERMSAPVVTIGPEQDTQAALALMQQRRLRRLPVVDGQGRLVGIVVERDLMLATLRTLPGRGEIADAMCAPVAAIAPDTDIREAARLMLAKRIGGLPVVEDGRLVGIVTESDIFRRFVEICDALPSAATSGR